MVSGSASRGLFDLWMPSMFSVDAIGAMTPAAADPMKFGLASGMPWPPRDAAPRYGRAIMPAPYPVALRALPWSVFCNAPLPVTRLSPTSSGLPSFPTWRPAQFAAPPTAPRVCGASGTALLPSQLAARPVALRAA